MKRVRTPWKLTASALVALAFAAGCEKEPERAVISGMPEYQVEARMGPKLTRVQIDSLIAMKARLGVARDEYWDARGGVVANENFSVWYPPGNQTITHAMTALDLLEAARARVAELFGAAPGEQLTVWCTQEMEPFVEWTGSGWWRYSRIERDRITYQPISILHQRGFLQMAVPREYFVWAMSRISDGKAPQWLLDGFASVLVNEGKILEDQLSEFPEDKVVLEPRDVDKGLAALPDKKAYRIAAFNAFNMMRRMVNAQGADRVAGLIAATASEGSLEAAAPAALGLEFDELMVTVNAWQREWER